MSKHYLACTANELDEAVEKVLVGYKDVTPVTASAGDVRIGKKIVDATGAVKDGTLNTDDYYNDGYSDGNTAGYSTGYAKGNTDGYNTGYSEGYDKGLEEATPTLQSKEAIPSLVGQEIKADTGFDGLLSVYVQAVPRSILDAEYQRGFDEAFELYKPYKQELTYIQSTGTQFIDTGFIPKSTTRVVASFTMMQTDSKWYKLWGSGNGSYTNDFSMWASGTTKLQVCYGNKNTTITCDGGQVYADANKNVWLMDGVTTTLTAQTFTCNYPMYIFSVNKDTNSSYVNAKIRLETFQVYDNGTLVRDYIPVLDWENAPCLYDKVTRKLYYNAGSGTFTYA